MGFWLPDRILPDINLLSGKPDFAGKFKLILMIGLLSLSIISRQVIIRNDMQLAYPTRPIERDCTYETQLLYFCHADLNINYQSTIVPNSGHDCIFIACRCT